MGVHVRRYSGAGQSDCEKLDDERIKTGKNKILIYSLHGVNTGLLRYCL